MQKVWRFVDALEGKNRRMAEPYWVRNEKVQEKKGRDFGNFETETRV